MFAPGNRVVLVQETDHSDLGDEACVLSINNGWVKVRLFKNNTILNVRNNPFFIVLDKIFDANAQHILRLHTTLT